MTFKGIWRTAVTFLVLNTVRIIADTYESMTDHENQMMTKGEFVFSTLSSQRQEALFEDFQISFSRKVKHNSNLTDDRNKWSEYLCLSQHHCTIQVCGTGGQGCKLRVIQDGADGNR